MEYHYDAFFSYNHNPRDMRLTRTLQQKLEHYKVPKDVVTKTGKTKIDRVFLDKGELEVAGDLNEEIMNALKNTDYLLVMCSPESCASPWVQKEIEFFLQYHTKDNVLTVLSAGEPSEVIPDVLKYREVTAEDGSVIREVAEPLSCDYRLPEKEADKVELPRLVAAIIGCRYDDLVQRKKQYRQKIIARIAAASAAAMTLLSAYMIWSNHQIRLNYRNTLIGQSRNLALQSKQALTQGNRIDAVRYAVEALPSEEQDRPVITEAVSALEKALSLYKIPGAGSELAVRQYKGVVNGKSQDDYDVYGIDTLTLGEKSCLIAIYSDIGHFCIWDTDTGEQLFTEYSDKLASEGVEVNNALQCDDGSLVLLSQDQIINFDLSASKERWRIRAEDYDLFNGYEACTAGDSLWVVADRDGFCISEIDTSSGKEIKSFEIEHWPAQLCTSADGSMLACKMSVYSDDTTDYFTPDHDEVMCFGPGEKDRKKLAEFPYVTDIRFNSDPQLLVTGLKEFPGAASVSSSTLILAGSGDSAVVAAAAEKKVCFVTCLETEDGSHVWDNEFSGIFNSEPEFSDPGTPEADGKTSCTIGNCLKLFDHSGKAKGEIRFGAPVMAYYSMKDDDRQYAVLADGSRGSASFKENNVYNVFDIFDGPLSCAATDGSSIFVVCPEITSKNDNGRIIEYNSDVYDSKWQTYDSLSIPEDAYLSDSIVAPYKEDFAILLRCEPDGGPSGFRSVLADSVSGEIKGKEGFLEFRDYYGYKYAGFNGESGCAYFTYADGDEIYIAALDVNTGETTEEVVAADPESSYSSIGRKAASDGGATVVFELCKDYSDYSVNLITVDTETMQAETVKLKDMVYDGYLSPACCFDTANGKVWLYYENEIKAFDMKSGEEVYSLEVDHEIEAMTVEKSGSCIMALEDTGNSDFLHVYDIDTKEETAGIDIGRFYSVSPELETEELDDGALLVHNDSSAVILDGSDFSMIVHIPDFSCYNPATKEICMFANGKLGHVPCRDVPDAIAEAREFIGTDE